MAEYTKPKRFTKGEWGKGELTPEGYLIYDRIEQEDLALVYDRNDEHGDDETEANAYLIAAAPAMYEALRKMLSGNMLDPSDPNRVWERECPSHDAIIKAYKALALAEGK